MIPLQILFLFAATLLVLPFGSSQAAGFDCVRAKGKDERLICDDPALSRADDELAAAYHSFRAKLDEPGRAGLRTEQRAWNAQRNRACGVFRDTEITDANRQSFVGCFAEEYRKRLASLRERETRLAGSASAATPKAAAAAPGSPPPRSTLERAGSGTGFAVSAAGHVVTNHHVVDDCAAVVLRHPDQAGLEARVLAADRRADLALLRAHRAVGSAATLRDTPVRLGEDVVVIGYPLTGLLSSGANLTTGNVSALAGLSDDTGKLQMTAPVQPGNSGGPVLDRDGSVIGVVVSKLDALAVAKRIGDIPQNVNFAVKGSALREFLDSNRVSYRSAPASADRNRGVAEIADAAQASIVRVECWK